MVLDIGKLSNKHFWPVFYNQRRFLIMGGGAGAGKSFAAAQKIIWRCLVEKVNHRFLILRKTNNSVYRSCQVLIEEILKNWGIPYKTVYLNISFGGNELIFSGLDDPEKVKSIHGITGVWMEESTEFSIKDFKQLNLRLRGELDCYKQIIMTFNPIGGKQAWLHKEFYDTEGGDNFTVNHSTWRDNDFIDEEYKIELQSEKNESLKQIYDLGLWAELQNAIYSRYKKLSLDVNDILRRADLIYGGTDFGFNDPSVFLLIAELDTDVYILKEIYERKLTNKEFITRIMTLLRDTERDVNAKIDNSKEDPISLLRISAYADAAEPARIKEFCQNGIRAQAADKKVTEGLDEVKRRDIFINTDCINSCKEIPAYCYKEDKDGNVLEEPVKYMDHTCDALRYGVYSSKRKGIILYV